MEMINKEIIAKNANAVCNEQVVELGAASILTLGYGTWSWESWGHNVQI